MKVALFKIGSKIDFSKKKLNGISFEIMSCIEMLNRCKDVELTIISTDKDEDYNIEDYSYFKEHYKEFDKMIVINGAVNYFGGAKNESLPEEVYYAMNLFDKEVFYLLYDPCLPLQNITKSALAKSFNSHWKESDLTISDKVHYITQVKNIESCKFLGQKSIHYFPLEKYPLLMNEMDVNPIDIENLSYDLIYGGTFRSGRREKKLLEFYFNYPEDIKVKLFGNIRQNQFKKLKNERCPEFGKSVDRQNLIFELRTSLSTICIGDSTYMKLDDIAQRFYESILAGHIIFVDKEYDMNNRCFKSKELNDFLHVKDKKDVIEKIHYLKNNTDNIIEIVNKQIEDILSDFDKDEYCNSFYDLLTSIA